MSVSSKHFHFVVIGPSPSQSPLSLSKAKFKKSCGIFKRTDVEKKIKFSLWGSTWAERQQETHRGGSGMLGSVTLAEQE